METLEEPALGSEARLTSPPDQMLHHADTARRTHLIMFPEETTYMDG